jgi:hypothetical protein
MTRLCLAAFALASLPALACAQGPWAQGEDPLAHLRQPLHGQPGFRQPNQADWAAAQRRQNFQLNLPRRDEEEERRRRELLNAARASAYHVKVPHSEWGASKVTSTPRPTGVAQSVKPNRSWGGWLAGIGAAVSGAVGALFRRKRE